MMPSLMHMPGFKFLFMWKPSRNANCDQLSSHDLRRIMLLQNELSNEQSPQFVIQDVQKQTVRFHELSLIWTTISGRIIRPKAVFIHAEKISVAAAPALYLGTRSFSCAVSGFESLKWLIKLVPVEQREKNLPALGTRGFFSRAADGNISLGFGGRRKAAQEAKRIIIQTWPTLETAQDKPLAPRVVAATFASSFSSKYTKQIVLTGVWSV